jgi:hypothetical protein
MSKARIQRTESSSVYTLSNGVFYIAMSILIVTNGFSTFLNIGGAQWNLSRVSDIVVFAIVGVAIVLVAFKKLDTNNGLGLGLISVLYAFVIEIPINLLNPEILPYKVYVSSTMAFFSVTIAGFIVNRYAVIIASIILGASIFVSVLIFGSPTLISHIPYIMATFFFLGGMIYHYRGRVLAIKSKIDSSKIRLEKVLAKQERLAS